jgi:hypothetical protein
MRRTGWLTLVLLAAVVAPAAGRVAPPPRGAADKVAPPPAPRGRGRPGGFGSLPPDGFGGPGASSGLRLARLEALTFDRRSSAILRAWGEQAADRPGGESDPLGREMGLFQRRVTLGRWAEVKAYLASLARDEADAAYRQLLRSLQADPPADAAASPAAGAAGGPGGGGFSGRGGGRGSRGSRGSQRGSPGGRPGGGPGSPASSASQPETTREPNHFTPDDVVGLAAAAPAGLDRTSLESLGGIVRTCLQGGALVETLVGRLKGEAAKPKGALTARQAAHLLAGAGEAGAIADFLPTLEKARQAADREGLNLLVRHYLARHAADKKPAWLESAWSAVQAALALPLGPGDRAGREEAIKQAVELAPQLRAELGRKWVEESFTRDPARGMTILATIGGLAAQGQEKQPNAPDARLKTLRLQQTAVEALLKASPARARQWRETLTLLAGGWLREAQTASQAPDASLASLFGGPGFGGGGGFGPGGFGPGGFGPPGFGSPYGGGLDASLLPSTRGLRPLSAGDVLSARPGPAWLAEVHADLLPKVRVAICRLYLKSNREADALEFIEDLARAQPKQARELAGEFLRVWARNHEAGPTAGMGSPYPFGFGGGGRGGRRGGGGRGGFGFGGGDATTLTRSRHERNLAELAGLANRLRKLPAGGLDEGLLVQAFAACYSDAEVYSAGAMLKVFGPPEALPANALSSLAEKMRENLAAVRRGRSRQQGAAKAGTTPKADQEVARGYAVARATVDAGLKKAPDDWSLVLVRGALQHDEVDFLREVRPDDSHAGRRLAAVAELERAANLYAGQVGELPEAEHSTRVYEQWLSASLGAVDLAQLKEERLPELSQAARIRAALLSLPGGLAAEHLERFAGQVLPNLRALPGQYKYRYLKAALEIVGEDKAAAEARKLFAYYQDLLREVHLETKIEGPAVVGHGRPFGVYVRLRHTRDMERASGGFGRYTQNQNGGGMGFGFGGPFGGGTGRDYRDRFQKAAAEALKEHFEVLSVTFETEKVRSRPAGPAGWRVTPYAYLLLKARGPQVDRLPPLRLDLDFQDSTGEVVVPVESPALVLDARPAAVEPRPVRRLEVTQTLDERRASEGKLLLEVKATGQGLVPELGRVLALEPEGFQVVRIDDPGVAVSKFDPDSDLISIVSERLWTVTFRARDGLTRLPTQFAFGKALEGQTKMHYQRYEDADLAAVSAVVALEAAYGERQLGWLWWSCGAAALLALLGALAWRQVRRRRRAPAAARWQAPTPLTPFTTIALLERIGKEGGLSEAQRAELAGTIRAVEEHYFAAGPGNGQVDLAELVGGWVRRAR